MKFISVPTSKKGKVTLNTLAYYEKPQMMAVKIFIGLAQG
jgi:hypothetical protein